MDVTFKSYLKERKIRWVLLQLIVNMNWNRVSLSPEGGAGGGGGGGGGGIPGVTTRTVR